MNLPLTPETRYLTGAEELKLLKPTTMFVNTGRGPKIDEKSLIKELENKKILSWFRCLRRSP